MIAEDFVYDGLMLSNWGYIICNFSGASDTNASDGETGSVIKQSNVSIEHSSWQPSVSLSYDGVLNTTFDICKNPCIFNDFYMSQREVRDMFSWLNRPEYHQLKICNEYHTGITFNATFNVQRIEIGNNVVGLRLTCTTDRPYGVGDEIKYTRDIEADKPYSFASNVDGDGLLYPSVDVTVQQSGNLDIELDDDYHVIINNVEENEVIHIENPMISTSVSSHEIQNDFNWNFFRLNCKYGRVQTKLKSNLPIHISYSYKPIVRFGL